MSTLDSTNRLRFSPLVPAYIKCGCCAVSSLLGFGRENLKVMMFD